MKTESCKRHVDDDKQEMEMPDIETIPRQSLNFIIVQKLVEENSFRYEGIEHKAVPKFEEACPYLPYPEWEGHDVAIDCYWWVWERAFANIKQASPENGFITNYIDTAFNGNLFMWDSAFILFFARYGIRAFDFQHTLNNFYHRQRRDGYICRELLPIPDGEQFHRHDPASTGPNVLAWCEYEYFLNTGDRERLARVFPAILAYHRWLRLNRTWQNGSYWTCGLASGMDNQDRIGCGRHDNHVRVGHGGMSWIDANAQALLSARRLVDMAVVLDRVDEVADEKREIAHLRKWINRMAWNKDTGFYFDVRPNGTTTNLKSIAAYWTLLADAVLPARKEQLTGWLEDPTCFQSHHVVPSLAKDTPGYDPTGGYWRGGVFPPTNYMVLRGLTLAQEDKLAYAIACNHHKNVVQVFEQTNTVWEYYAPESVAPGGQRPDRSAVQDFVGWGGLGPVAVLFEYIFGLRPNVPESRLVWDVQELSAFGVKQYPFGRECLIDLNCQARSHPHEKPVVEVKSTCPLTLELRWPGGAETRSIPPSEH